MGRGQDITIRKLNSHADFAAAVSLQKEIWGFEDLDLLPVRLFVVASKIGGQCLGAFAGDGAEGQDGEKMVGFCLAIPGLKARGKSYLHSHMLGILDGYRDLGLGKRLKLAQREDAIARGVDLIEWTFDPLELRNAFFNIERLGAVVRRFVFNQYGTTSSSLHGGLPTDRCIAEWYVSSERVAATIAQFGKPAIEPLARISVPQSIGTLKRQDPVRARAIQATISEQFDSHFAAGLVVTGFERTAEYGTYLLSPWQLK